MNLAEAVLAGERLALARLLTQVENDTSEGRMALDTLFAYTGRAVLVGITGAPGTGKSTLVNQLARCIRHPADGSLPRKVGIVAVDPSSPFTGGALMGDRVRMRDLAGDPGVFIRSMASRGALGGLARTTVEVVQVLDAAGFDLILIETVGVGQDEVDIARLAHTTVVVEAPGLGDDIQAIKAGILEIADILVVNKADQTGAENTERALRAMLEMGASHRGNGAEQSEGEPWQIPVIRTIATQGEGIAELAAEITRHAAYLRASGEWQRREDERLRIELDLLVQERLVAHWRSQLKVEQYQEVLEAVKKRNLSPFQAVERLME
jgi:LAO/AO transport system kinase